MSGGTMGLEFGERRATYLDVGGIQKGRFLGSGPGHQVLEEAGLDGQSQYEAIKRYIASS